MNDDRGDDDSRVMVTNVDVVMTQIGTLLMTVPHEHKGSVIIVAVTVTAWMAGAGSLVRVQYKSFSQYRGLDNWNRVWAYMILYIS